MDKSMCILISRAPYGTVPAAEGVRHLSGALQSGLSAVAVLVDDGVWLARARQTPGGSGFTSLSEALHAALNSAALPLPRVLVHQPSLAERGLSPADLLAGVEFVDDTGLAQVVATNQYLLRF